MKASKLNVPKSNKKHNKMLKRADRVAVRLEKQIQKINKMVDKLYQISARLRTIREMKPKDEKKAA
jgi:division protein CdvB (Snf7/Vps24/ESCRT-III family)